MRLFRVPVLLLVLIGLAACGSDGTQEPVASPTAPVSDSYSGLVAASEFVVGENRFPFGLVDVNGAFLEEAAVSVRFYLVDTQSGEGTLKAEANARWKAIPSDFVHVHPDGEEHLHLDFQGAYVVDEVGFDEPGVWVAEFSALAGGNQQPEIEEAAFQVIEAPRAIGVGEAAPPTDNPTIDDAPFAELSTRQVESDEMHNVSVAEALEVGEPFVVVFASPQFCVSAMCGPVVEVMDEARQELGGDVEFIHIEPWDLDAARNEGRLEPSQYLLEWRLPTEPWVYVVDADGRVAARFEGLVTGDEVVAAVEALG